MALPCGPLQNDRLSKPGELSSWPGSAKLATFPSTYTLGTLSCASTRPAIARTPAARQATRLAFIRASPVSSNLPGSGRLDANGDEPCFPCPPTAPPHRTSIHTPTTEKKPTP